MAEHTDDRSDIRRLWGVYHADGGIVGELTYVIGKLRGTAHCALCDITHGLRLKPEWKVFADALDIPFELVHLNEQPAPLAEVTAGRTPCVVAQSRGGLEMLLGPDELESASGSVERFAVLLREALGG